MYWRVVRSGFEVGHFGLCQATMSYISVISGSGQTRSRFADDTGSDSELVA